MDSESTTNWEGLFSDLNKTEDELLNSVELLNKAVNMKKYVKTGQKVDDWRNLHNIISKMGKTVEKFYSGYNFENNSTAEKLNSGVWKSAIFETLIREGYTFSLSCLDGAENHSKAYAQLSEFIESFDYNSDLIFEWIKDNFPESSDKENLLAEFTQFLFFEKLHNNNLQDALIFIRNQIKYFKNPENQKSISKLLTKCLYSGPNTPSKFCEKRDIEGLKDHFVKSYCRFEKIPKSDPLTACNEIGTKSIPPLDRLNSLFKGKNYSSLNPEEELPIELAVDEDFVFHSIFCCPVIKQQSSDDNPAYLLPCSHALSKEALNRLSKGNALVYTGSIKFSVYLFFRRFKCPYCPSETNLSNCLQLNF